jgi:hypothetical protein
MRIFSLGCGWSGLLATELGHFDLISLGIPLAPLSDGAPDGLANQVLPAGAQAACDYGYAMLKAIGCGAGNEESRPSRSRSTTSRRIERSYACLKID